MYVFALLTECVLVLSANTMKENLAAWLLSPSDLIINLKDYCSLPKNYETFLVINFYFQEARKTLLFRRTSIIKRWKR